VLTSNTRSARKMELNFDSQCTERAADRNAHPLKYMTAADKILHFKFTVYSNSGHKSS